MKQLLEITTVPIVLEYSTSSASVSRKSQKTQMNLNIERGGVKMKSKQADVGIDISKSMDSLVNSVGTLIKKNAQEGLAHADETAQKNAQEGDLFLSQLVNKGESKAFNQIAKQNFNSGFLKPKDAALGYTPSAPVEFNWSPPNLEIQYETDKLTFDWRVQDKVFDFTPASFDLIIKQYPRVSFQYIGEPLYVGANPNSNYTPINIEA